MHICPDVASVGILLCFSTVGDRSAWSTEYGLRNICVPYLTIVLIMSLMLQTRSTRSCLTRFFLESQLVRTIGYASYPIYLLQQVLLNFYLRMAYDAVLGVPVSSNPSYGAFWENEWFGNRRPWWKLIGLVYVVGVGYLVQYYYQDRWIAGLWSAWLMRRMGKKG